MEIFLYTAPNLRAETERLQAMLASLAQEYAYNLHVVDISANAFLMEAYQDKLPRLEVGAFTLGSNVSAEELEFALSKTQLNFAQSTDRKRSQNLRIANKSIKFSAWDLISLWFSKHYLQVIIGLLILIVGLAFLAPVLMEAGWIEPAQSLYALYRPFCHQLAFRSLFLYGSQPFYPREIAKVTGPVPYGQATGLSESDFAAASAFLGTPEVGYKVALCQRDIAIQSALLLFALIFVFSGQKIKPVPIILWALLGFLPIVWDGGTQLLSQLGWQGLAWMPARESAPWQRLLTGGLFGFFSAWFILPLLHASLQASRLTLEKKAILVAEQKTIKAGA